MGRQHWKVEKQPDWYIAAVRRTIAELPGGYVEAAEVLGLYKTDDATPSDNAVHNRLRTDGDQFFPIGWAMVLQKAAGVTHVTDAMSRETDGGMHVPGIDVEDDNVEISLRLAEMVGKLGELVDAYRRYAADDVITREEWRSLNEIAYQFKVTLMLFLNIVSLVHCEPEMKTRLAR